MKLTIRWRALWGAMKAAWPVWLLLAGITAAFGIGLLACSQPADSLRWAGMLLQFFGLLMVAHGLSKLRRDFAQPPLSAKMVAWFKRLAAIFRTPEPITLEGSAGSYALAGAEVTLEHKVGPGASLERRLEVLEKNFELFRDETSTKVRGLREDLAAARKSIERETHERQAEDKKVARMIEEVAIGGLDLEMVGLFWLILGVIFTSIPT